MAIPTNNPNTGEVETGWCLVISGQPVEANQEVSGQWEDMASKSRVDFTHGAIPLVILLPPHTNTSNTPTFESAYTHKHAHTSHKYYT